MQLWLELYALSFQIFGVILKCDIKIWTTLSNNNTTKAHKSNSWKSHTICFHFSLYIISPYFCTAIKMSFEFLSCNVSIAWNVDQIKVFNTNTIGEYDYLFTAFTIYNVKRYLLWICFLLRYYLLLFVYYGILNSCISLIIYSDCN